MLPGRRTTAALRVPVTPAGGVIGTDRRFHAVCCCAYTLLLTVWCAYAGRDLSFDLLNYHYYAAYSFLTPRFDQDFFAASMQGYLNPVATLPFYLLASAGLSSIAVTVILGAMQSCALWLLHALAWLLFEDSAHRRRDTLLATLLGLACPVLLIGAGTSYVDNWTLVPLLAMLVGLTRLHRLAMVDDAAPASRNRAIRWAVLTGACAGVAVAVKLTAALAVACLVVVVVALACVSRTWRGALRPMALAAVLGVVVMHASWGARVWAATGNPFYPQFGWIFDSPYAADGASRHLRFLPMRLAEWVTLPWRMLLPQTNQYIEASAPDIRPMALCCLLGCAALAGVMHRVARARAVWRVGASSRPASERTAGLGLASGRHRALPRPMTVFNVFLMLYAALWLSVSGNGRYGLTVLVLLAIPLVGLVARVVRRADIQFAVCAALLVVQGVQQTVAGTPRLQREPAAARWLDFDINPVLRASPALFLSTGDMSMSFLAPMVHPDSSFVDVGMQFPIVADTPRFDMLQRLLQRHATAWALVTVGARNENRLPIAGNVGLPRVHLNSLGLDLDDASCVPVGIAPMNLVIEMRGAAAISGDGLADQGFIACPLRRGQPIRRPDQRVTAAFRSLSALCPVLMYPPSAPVFVWSGAADGDGLNGQYYARFNSSDTQVRLRGRRFDISSYRRAMPVDLGTLDDVLNGHARPDCESVRRELMSSADVP